MKDLSTLVKDWWTVKTAKNPNPELEAKIIEERRKLHDNVSLLRLAESEVRYQRQSLRFDVMQELINTRR
jgi:hypothetical protein